MRRLGRPQDADRGADYQDAEEDQAGDAAALTEHAVGNGRGREGEKECDHHSHAARILSIWAVAVSASERRTRIAQEDADGLRGGIRPTRLAGRADKTTAD